MLDALQEGWLDDQLAMNQLVWFGMRNHADRAVHAASANARVINITTLRYGNGHPDGLSPPAGGERVCSGTHLTALRTPPCWCALTLTEWS